MRFRALLALLWLTALAVTTARADPPQAEARPGYIADHECAACHPRQAAAFEGSKHRHAMAPASPASVRADFADTRFDGPARPPASPASWRASWYAPRAPTAGPPTSR